MKTEDLRVMDTEQLKDAVRQSNRQNFNRNLASSLVQRLDPTGIHVVRRHMPFGDADGMRLDLLVKVPGSMKGVEATIDVTWDFWNSLLKYGEIMSAVETR